MNKLLSIGVVALLLVGCANTEYIQARVGVLSDQSLCSAVATNGYSLVGYGYYPNIYMANVQAAIAELRARGRDCNAVLQANDPRERTLNHNIKVR